MSQETTRPLCNKLAPAMLEPSRRGTTTRTSPFYTRERDAHMGRHDPKEHGDYRAAKMPVGTERVWREKQKLHHSLRANLHTTDPNTPIQEAQDSLPEPVRSLERNLAVSDYPPPPSRVPTTEEVMQELVDVSIQYTNCADHCSCH